MSAEKNLPITTFLGNDITQKASSEVDSGQQHNDVNSHNNNNNDGNNHDHNNSIILLFNHIDASLTPITIEEIEIPNQDYQEQNNNNNQNDNTNQDQPCLIPLLREVFSFERQYADKVSHLENLIQLEKEKSREKLEEKDKIITSRESLDADSTLEQDDLNTSSNQDRNNCLLP